MSEGEAAASAAPDKDDPGDASPEEVVLVRGGWIHGYLEGHFEAAGKLDAPGAAPDAKVRDL